MLCVFFYEFIFIKFTITRLKKLKSKRKTQEYPNTWVQIPDNNCHIHLLTAWGKTIRRMDYFRLLKRWLVQGEITVYNIYSVVFRTNNQPTNDVEIRVKKNILHKSCDGQQTEQPNSRARLTFVIIKNNGIFIWKSRWTLVSTNLTVFVYKCKKKTKNVFMVYSGKPLDDFRASTEVKPRGVRSMRLHLSTVNRTRKSGAASTYFFLRLWLLEIRYLIGKKTMSSDEITASWLVSSRLHERKYTQ